MDQVRLARQSNRVVLRARLYRISAGRRRMSVQRGLAGAERDRVWRAFVEMYPQGEHYTWFTRRALPLVALATERT